MYMSYCKFEGTRQELKSCLATVEEHVYNEAEYEVSEREIDHFKAMIREFHNFMFEMNLLDENGDLNENQLENIADLMSIAYEETAERTISYDPISGRCIRE